VARPDDLVRATVRDLEPYSWELSTEAVAERHGLAIDRVVRFDLNTSPFPPAAWDAALEAARGERRPNEYFDTGYAELTPLFADYCGVPADHIIVGAGADEILDIVSKTFLDNGDAVVLSVPTYSMYPIVTEQLGATIRMVPLGPGFEPDVDALLAAAQGAKIIWVCNPNSPTANAADPAALERLVAGAPCVVVVDEAYAEYAGWSAVPLLARYSNLVVVRTMSKAFGMAGMRLGWGVGQPPVISYLNRVRPPNSVSRVTARLGAAALRDLPAMRSNVDAVVREREPMVAALRRLGVRVHPSVTNFLLTDWGSAAEANDVYEWLEARGMVVRNFAEHRLLPGHLRITVRSAEENGRLLAALEERRRAAAPA
jgi:histidinol-phosphate aminotransferase